MHLRDVRVEILIWFQTYLLFTKPHFQTFNALKSTTFQAFQIISDFFSQTLSHPWYLYTPFPFQPSTLPLHNKGSLSVNISPPQSPILHPSPLSTFFMTPLQRWSLDCEYTCTCMPFAILHSTPIPLRHSNLLHHPFARRVPQSVNIFPPQSPIIQPSPPPPPPSFA